MFHIRLSFKFIGLEVHFQIEYLVVDGSLRINTFAKPSPRFIYLKVTKNFVEVKNEQKMLITYKFRLYPNQEQEEKLLRALERCRFVYNDMLYRLKNQDKSNRSTLQNSLPKFKEQYPELKDVYSKALQYEVYRLFSNLKSCKSRNKLRYKSKGNFKTIHYNQSGFKITNTGKRLDLLHLSKIGDIPIKIHRDARGKIKQVIVKRYCSGRWYACITVENDMIIHKQPVKKAIGIDMGIKYFLTDSDGKQIENPVYLKKTLKRLRRRQKRMSKTKKGSNNRNKQRVKVARLHERITNQRNDFLHKLSGYYINNYDMIVVEDLKIKNLVRNHHLAQSISDVSWYRFAQILSYKAGSAGKTLVKVDPRNTSRKYKHGALDRDYNAALNILERGLQKIVGMGQTEFTPVDIKPLQELVSVPASRVVESGSLLQNQL